MGECYADCLERPLSRGFRKLGKVIARNPWGFIIIPIVLSVGLGVGLCFLEQREINKLEELFTPEWGIAKVQRDFIKMYFPINDSGQFSVQRLYTVGTFASLIVVSTSKNILNGSNFEELLKLDATVKNLTSKSCLRFSEVCAEINGPSCLPANPLLNSMNNSTKDILITYPLLPNGEYIGLYIGGVTLGPGNHLQKAQALRFLYYLKDDKGNLQGNSLEWLEHFMKVLPREIEKLHLKSLKVYHSTSISLQKEFDRSTENIIPLFCLTYVVTVLFSILSCVSFDNVRNKIWLATTGVISPGLAILTSFGMLLLCGVPFARTVANAPFLILGVGVDNMFIIISCWRQTKVTSTVEERMADTYQEAAVSITITTLTDVLAFYIGIMTHFPSVQSFCIYTGTALVFCYIYCITFFGAILALNGLHESNNRHWLICMKVNDKKDDKRSVLYNACCVGGLYDPTRETEIEHPITVFFYKYYGPFLTKPWTKVFVLVLYLLYLSASIYGCVQIQDGIDIRNLAKANSSLTHFYDVEALYFSKYGPRVMVVVTNEVDYWDIKTREIIEACMRALEKNHHIAKEYTVSWLRIYEKIAKDENLNITTKENFMKHLNRIYQHFSQFEQDIVTDGHDIKTSRFFIQAIDTVTVDDGKNMLNHLRDVTANCNIEVFVYHPLFIYLDQYVVIIQNTIQNIVVATVVMLVISILFIPDPLCSLWVTFAIASIIASVNGFMYFWKVNLDSISMINLVICIGFSVDFSAHIVYASVCKRKPNANQRVIDALHVLGYPVVQGALSTILGIATLSAAESYIFRSFFKIMFLVITFGALHGLLLMPVFLMTVGTCTKPGNSIVESKNDKGNNEKVSPPAVIYRVHPLASDIQMKRPEVSLPGYAILATSNVRECNSLNRDYCCMSWQGGVYSVLHADVKQKDDDNGITLVEYRRRMLQVYLEDKPDRDCGIAKHTQ
ncbi:patched domain-containing protein 3-like [Hyla sarda]|uniref:patched domain-containing protein 3-like n=1 Tax=Hyla sarda TaxID=327740 RepID=UPI0024C2831E|nr:patched domain-containing protein 3-like [Hyla sarda]